ncbi:MAG: hypothetical protein DRP06_04440 [Candidatus Aenigmatarchaeota archaeon]|nr:MAG: hypothetical protein DRP06_04440 [Candidatus Aenigmarchaeota archaeon]
MENKEKNGAYFYISIIFLILSIVLVANSLYSIYMASDQMSKQYGTGISSGWRDSMAWLKNNTPECTVIATYWDPGYWINALSERRTIYDGGCQHAIRHTKLDELNGLDCIEDRGGYLEEKDGVRYCVTSRMMDMAGCLYTSNETKAAKILESYMGNCSDLYFLASNDLIGKSQWWTYFSTWNPELGKGQAANYAMVRLEDKKALRYENGTAFVYGPFYLKVVFENNTQKIEPLLYQQGKYHKIKTLVLTQNNTPMKITYENATVPGTLWVDSSLQLIIYMPLQTENSMFTRMFFYNGEGLKYFEPAYRNPEVRLFKFKVEEFRKDLEDGII